MKPMLADALEGAPKFPVLASPKIDGIRCLIVPDGHLSMAVSRSLKPIRNEFVQGILSNTKLRGLDGELCVGPAYAKDLMQRTTSGVMSADGEPDFTFWVFDKHDEAGDYGQRSTRAIVAIEAYCKETGVPYEHSRVRWLKQQPLLNQAELDAFENECLEQGYEGVMLRQPEAPYKFGRSRNSDGALLKLKRFEDAEAVVIGVEELMHNENEAKTNELGRTQRSTAKAGLVGAGTLGKLIVRREDGVEFGIGSGFTAAQRKELWGIRNGHPPTDQGLVGRLVKYRHFAAGGVKVAPRFPVFVGFRDPEDLS